MERSGDGGSRTGDRGILSQQKLDDLAAEIDSKQVLDEDVQDVLLQMADDFIDSVVSASCQLAKHRKSGSLEVKDLQAYLESSWNMTMPGFSSDSTPSKRSSGAEAHKQRLGQIKKSKR